MKASDRYVDGVDLGLLTQTTQRIVKAVGLPAALLLMEKLGGTYVELPQGARIRREAHALDDVIGAEAAGRFFDAFHDYAQRKVLIQKHDKVAAQLRDQAIRAQPRSVSNRTLALQYRLSERWVIAIRNTVDEPTPQRDMFGSDAG